MALRDIFKKKKKDDFLDIEGLDKGPSGYGPAGYPGEVGPAGPPTATMDMGLPGMGPQITSPAGGDLETVKRELETLSYKIDSLRALIDNLTAKMDAIERHLKGSQKPSEEAGWTY